MSLKDNFKGFNLIYWNPMGGSYFLRVLFWKNVEKYEKRPFFRVATARLGKYSKGSYMAGLGTIGLISEVSSPLFACWHD